MDRFEADAKEAAKQASKAKKDTVKGLRTVHHFEVTNYKEVLNYMASNHREMMIGIMDDFVRKNSKTETIPGVKTWETKEAY